MYIKFCHLKLELISDSVHYLSISALFKGFSVDNAKLIFFVHFFTVIVEYFMVINYIVFLANVLFKVSTENKVYHLLHYA